MDDPEESLLCPDCGHPLIRQEDRGLQIAECGHCRGRWFDREELRKAKDSADEDLCWLDFDPFSGRGTEFRPAREDRICPKCRRSMEALAYGNSGVVLDVCGTCRGVWVHHGEFEKIIRHLEEVITSKPASDYVVESFKKVLDLARGGHDAREEIRDFLTVLKLLKLRTGVEHPHLAETINKLFEWLPFL